MPRANRSGAVVIHGWTMCPQGGIMKKLIMIAACCMSAFFAACGDRENGGASSSCDPDFEKRYDQLLEISKNIRSEFPAKAVSGERNEVVFLGDSTTEGYGIDREKAFPALIGGFWRRNGISLKAFNAGVSGNTVADVSSRLDDVIRRRPLAVFVVIGANDYFLRTPVRYVRSCYGNVISRLQSEGIEVMIGDVAFPKFFPGYEEGYTSEFNAMTPYLAKKYGCRVLPSIYSAVFVNGAFLPDGRHPDLRGHELLAQCILRFMNGEWKYDVR